MSDFDGDRLRSVMRRVATPVTVVTFLADGERRGVTIGSFTSVSLNPPLVAFNVDRDTTIHNALVTAERIIINILAEDQAFLGNHFALSDLTSAEQFEPVTLDDPVEGIPVLSGSSAVLECELHDVHRAGDSSMLVCRVRSGGNKEGVRPLLYFDRSYREVGQEREPSLFEPVNRSSSETP